MTMRAAIYARKSTDQNGRAEEDKSVARQVAHARQYAQRRGWTVDDAQVYVDDGISGAEFAARPGFLRLMNALKPRAPFQVLVMSEESRLGREAIETAYALKQLVQAGVRVFFYLEDRERTLDSPTDKIMLSLTAFADELERERARLRTYDALQRKARAGFVTGGRVFGYDNVDVLGPTGERSHVERRINEPEAAIVRRIFALCARGEGLTAVTKLLNAEHLPAPRAGGGRAPSWSASSVREILRRPLYRGEIVWNQTRKRDRWGQQHQHARPDAEWLRVPAPALRIVSDEAWDAAHRKIAERQAVYTSGLRPHQARYLLSGFARCALCGGGFASHTRMHGKTRVAFYACTAHWKRGPEVCGNDLIGRMDALNAAVLAKLQDEILHPAVIERAIELALDELSPARVHAHRSEVEARLSSLEDECRRLADAIARGGPLDALLDRLRTDQADRDALRAQLAGMGPAPVVVPRAGWTRRLHAKLAEWRDLLGGDVEAGRAVLQHLVVEQFRFTPIVGADRREYHFRGLLALERVVSGVIELPPATLTGVASPTGSSDGQRARTKMASPAGFGAGPSWAVIVDGSAPLRLA